MLLEGAFFSALLMGFFGSSHCMAMCGGIAGILSQADAKTSFTRKTKIAIAYNIGRITSYSFIGLLAGTIGLLAFKSIDSASLYQYSRIFTSIFMLAFGFYLLGWGNFLVVLEKKAQFLWKKISPLTKNLLPVKNIFQAFLVGLLWGWLPCGLVYSAVVWSLSTSSPINGALLMLFFGLGTLPALLTIGIASEKLAKLKNSAWVRNVSAGIIIVYAILHLFSISLFQQQAAHSHMMHMGH